MSKVITPKVWGEDAWRFMHVVALGFPDKPDENTKTEYKQFYDSFQHVLPCANCRQGYATIFKSNPIRLDSREDLFIWTVEVHNAVNRKLGHDVMSPDWIRNTYVFREHEKESDSILSKAKYYNSDIITFIAISSIILSVVICGISYFAFRKHFVSTTSSK
jgi:hypothetical protein